MTAHRPAERPQTAASRKVQMPALGARYVAAPRGGKRSSAEVLALQRTLGNRAVSRLLDEEQHVHDGAGGYDPAAQRAAVEEVLSGSGNPLSVPVQAKMEAKIGNGADFSGVRMHTGAAAERATAAVGARALTSGNHVVIGKEGADESTLLHELTHVDQQSKGEVSGTDNGAGMSLSDPNDRFERQATANERLAHAPVPTMDTEAAGTPLAAQRAVDDPPAPGLAHPGARGTAVQRASRYSDDMDVDDYDRPQIITVEPRADEMMDVDYGYGSRQSAGRPRIVGADESRASRLSGSGSGSRTHRERPASGVGGSRGARSAYSSRDQERRQRRAEQRTRALQIGNGVLSGTNRRIRYGSQNQIRSIVAYGPTINESLSAVRGVTRYPVGSFQQRLGQDAAAAEAVGVGNCGEHAAMAFCLLNREHLPQGSVIYYVDLNLGHDEDPNHPIASYTDHVFVAFGNPSDPENMVVVDAWQGNARAQLASDFNFPFLVRGPNGLQVTPRARAFHPDGTDYLAAGRHSIDVESLESRMDTSGSGSVDPESLRGAPGIYQHDMPEAETRQDSGRHHRHHHRRR
ncbi:MAG TPA: DUF4157 domain-containing protein [Trebonia sp.]